MWTTLCNSCAVYRVTYFQMFLFAKQAAFLQGDTKQQGFRKLEIRYDIRYEAVNLETRLLDAPFRSACVTAMHDFCAVADWPTGPSAHGRWAPSKSCKKGPIFAEKEPLLQRYI